MIANKSSLCSRTEGSPRPSKAGALTAVFDPFLLRWVRRAPPRS